MSQNSTREVSLSQDLPDPVELVLFYGPPCSGKTRFYNKEYAHYKRISPRDDYPNKSLHYVVSEATKLLRGAHGVVVDDSNAHEDTRQSYIARVKEALPHARVTLVVFRPQHGVRQCEWQLEWQLAAACQERGDLAASASTADASHGTYVDWSAWQKTFDHEPVSLLEGFTSTRYVNTALYSPRPAAQFATAALIVEAQALVEFSIDELFQVTCSPHAHVARVLHEWARLHGTWRLIVLVDESALYPMNIELIEDPELQITVIQRCREAFEQQLRALQLHKPIYYLVSEYNSFEQNHFFKLHKGGMLAWTQMRHGLALGQCTYVTAGPKNAPVAVPCGLKYCHASDLFNDNGWGIDSKLRKYTREQSSPATAALLHDVEYSDAPFKSTVEPLQPSANSSEWSIMREQGGFGRGHACCWPGSIAVSAEVPARAVVRSHPVIMETERTPPKKGRSLPEWLSPDKQTPSQPRTTNTNVIASPPREDLPAAEPNQDPISQDIHSQTSLFDNLSNSQDSLAMSSNSVQVTPKRKRSEGSAESDEDANKCVTKLNKMNIN